MPTKQKRTHHRGKKDEKHTKRFLKAYAPYLPLVIIVGFGLYISIFGGIKKPGGDVLAYATNMSDSGLLDSTNKERQDNGLNPLTYSTTLDQAAQAKAEDMAKRDYWSHNTPDGKEPWIFIDSAGYKYFKAAENLAYGFESSRSAVVGWMNSPSHRANILDGDLKEVGFGIVNVENYQNKGPETIVVAMYGLPVPATATVASTTPNSNTEGAGTEISIPKPQATFANASSPSESKNISYAQMITGGSMPWISFAVGIAIGLMVMYLVLKHTRNIVRVIKNGENFILHHPLLDTTIIALLALATIVTQTAGTIY